VDLQRDARDFRSAIEDYEFETKRPIPAKLYETFAVNFWKLCRGFVRQSLGLEFDAKVPPDTVRWVFTSLVTSETVKVPSDAELECLRRTARSMNHLFSAEWPRLAE